MQIQMLNTPCIVVLIFLIIIAESLDGEIIAVRQWVLIWQLRCLQAKRIIDRSRLCSKKNIEHIHNHGIWIIRNVFGKCFLSSVPFALILKRWFAIVVAQCRVNHLVDGIYLMQHVYEIALVALTWGLDSDLIVTKRRYNLLIAIEIWQISSLKRKGVIDRLRRCEMQLNSSDLIGILI